MYTDDKYNDDDNDDNNYNDNGDTKRKRWLWYHQ